MSINLKVGIKKRVGMAKKTVTVHDSIKENPFWSGKCVSWWCALLQ